MNPEQSTGNRIGIDLGGTKIEAIVMDVDGNIVQRERTATPANDYQAILDAVDDIVDQLTIDDQTPVGIGTPGAISLVTGLMKNCNSTCLNGQPLPQALEAKLGRKIKIANDADCFTLSEASDGAAAGNSSVFGVILGTGVGGGICIKQTLLSGVSAICGEWGHNTLALQAYQGEMAPTPGRLCYCGRYDCVETWLSGPGLAKSYADKTGISLPAQDIVKLAENGDQTAANILEQYDNLLALSLSVIINILDPESIVLGGGMSNIKTLYSKVNHYLPRYVFTDQFNNNIIPALHGDSSGVRGAAWLWP